MKTVDYQLSLLSRLARKQKIVNLILLIFLLSTLWLIQTKIDAEVGFFLQGYGRCVYWLAGIAFVLLWSGLSNSKKRNSFKSHLVIYQGKIDTAGNDPRIIRLLLAYHNVTKKLGVDPLKYTLMVRLDESTNAFATGLNQGKTICVFQGVLEKTNMEELESMIAHEFGHTVNKDMAFAVLRSSLGCGISLASGTIGFIIVWATWGFWNAVLFYMLVGVLIPILSNYSSRITEQFADSYATIHGFGRGLQSVFGQLDFKKYGLFGSHPHPIIRVKYIQEILDADQGVVPDKAEGRIWFVLKFATILLAAGYLMFIQGLSFDMVLPFLLAGGLFLSADSTLNSSGASWQASMQLNKGNRVGWSTVIAALFWLGLHLVLFGSGVWASFLFISSTSVTLAFLSKICLVAWAAKPITSILGFGNDLFATVSDLTTYAALITSLLMMASFFIAI